MKTQLLQGTIAALIISASHTRSLATVLHVPADYATIQTAINSSVNGDTVLVSPGIYSENINFKGKAIIVTSTNASDPDVVRNTIIHGVGHSSVVTFSSNEKSNSILTGFTIAGGYGTVNASLGTNVYWGGGIFCYLASPTITGNIITGNSGPNGSTSDVGYGAGVACVQSDAILSRNFITANNGYAGSGLLVYLGKARIVSNLIHSNTAVIGGGIVLISGGQVINNTFVKNSAQFVGNVYASSDTTGRCLLTNNLICSATSGGGIYVDTQDTFTQVAFNDVWNNTGGDYYAGQDSTGTNGNISQDPSFINPANDDYHLRDVSPCINAGDPNSQSAPGELDFYGDARIYARRVDIGAAEYSDNFRPVADAGPDQLVTVTSLPFLITLNGSASADPNGLALTYQWSQVSGPLVALNGAGPQPVFNAPELGTYTFALVVNDGSFGSFSDTVQITLTNAPPLANAGENQWHDSSSPVPSITLDGSHSSDPENVALTYHWQQVSGWNVRLSDPTAVNPTFMNPWPGTYVFELIVNDGLQDSAPDAVTITIGPNHAPVADAGFSRYIIGGTLTLDGTHSYDPDGSTLTYQWRQISGPTVPMTGTNISKPVVTFAAGSTVRKCTFELTVSDGVSTSAPSTVSVTIVPNYGANVLQLANPPFDPARPTIVAFGGGNCSTGSGLTFGGVWNQRANWITVNSYGPPYAKYGDMLMVYLSGVSSNYSQPIQTIGFSTGNLPAMEVGWYLNATYKDARYAVNRVSLLDAVCSNLSGRVSQFSSNPIAGEQCWVDNYISNDPGFNRQPALPGALNVVCNPARAHSYPVNRYAASSFDYTNGGLTAFAYLSAIGSGKNYQLNTASNKYYFVINSSESIVFFNQSLYPGKVLAPVLLNGPADGDIFGTNGATFGCQPVENAVRYQLLFGSDPRRVMDFSIVSDTPAPPKQDVTTLPLRQTWWTVRAYDQFGSSIYADPRLIKSPENRPPVADAGPDLTVYAGLDGKATVVLDASRSSDPDGDALAFTWAYLLNGVPYLSNGVSLTLELPPGSHTVQLMANDGQANSEPDEVTITVVAPLECSMKISPSTINLRSGGLRILSHIQFPAGFTGADVDGNSPILIYPGGVPVTKWWTGSADADSADVFAFFNRNALGDQLHKGWVELTVTGKLQSGQIFYGRDTVQVIKPGKAPGFPPQPRTWREPKMK